MKRNSLLIAAGCIGLIIIGIGVFSVGWLAGRGFLIGDVSAIVDAPAIPLLNPTVDIVQNEQNEQVESQTPDLQELFQPFWEVWDIIHDEFVDQPVDDQAMMRGAINGMLDVIGVEVVNKRHIEYLDNLFSSPEGTETELEEMFLPFWAVWYITHGQIDDFPVDDVKLVRGAINGMLDALGDPHTSYMDPEQFLQANFPLEGEYEGIGAWVDTEAEYLTIISPMEGSPAEAAGLQPGDEIIAVDGEDMTGIDASLVVRRVLGPAGSTVVLTIQREGTPEPFDVEIVRERIILPSVESEMLEEHIAYVRLFNFGETTTSDMRDAISELLEQEPIGLILDLRNNGGGFLTTAISVASEFIEDGVVMYEVYGDDVRKTYEAHESQGLATDIPMVVLINEGSASASEIVAGAIQDLNRGLLVGTTSFGKGSVQQWIPLSNQNGAVRVTIARFLTPNERQISEIGLDPDVYVDLTPEDFEADRDPQLDKAIEILLNQ